MHVLRKVHGWLRPGGKMVDIHPEPEPADVEVVGDAGVVRVGAFERNHVYPRIHLARAALAEMVEAGLYAAERSVTFEVVSHFESAEAWLAYRAARGSSTEVDPTLVAHAAETLGKLNSRELLVRERLRATRYRRKG